MFIPQSYPTLQPQRLWPIPCPWKFPGKNTGMGCRSFLQGIFPLQGLNPHILRLLHWQVGGFFTNESLGKPQFLKTLSVFRHLNFWQQLIAQQYFIDVVIYISKLQNFQIGQVIGYVSLLCFFSLFFICSCLFFIFLVVLIFIFSMEKINYCYLFILLLHQLYMLNNCPQFVAFIFTLFKVTLMNKTG